MATMAERYEACMVLHAVGDAMGYRNGEWEFNVRGYVDKAIDNLDYMFALLIFVKYSGPDIHKHLEKLGGVDALTLNTAQWRVSDDTVLNLAIAEYVTLIPRF